MERVHAVQHHEPGLHDPGVESHGVEPPVDPRLATVTAALKAQPTRAIILIDMDAFYSQVEQVRLGLTADDPIVVQQWDSFIAVSYSARRFGIRRNEMTVLEAHERCPELRAVHVATYAPGQTDYRYHAHPDRQTHKVSLEPYRDASAKVMAVLSRPRHGLAPRFERASIDEAFLDVTEIVLARLAERFADYVPPGVAVRPDLPPAIDWTHAGRVITAADCEDAVALPGPSVTSDSGGLDGVCGDRDRCDGPAPSLADGAPDPRDEPTWDALQLRVAADLCAEIRGDVLKELGYTCSAGIAHSKTVAKLLAGRHKPNQQTLLTEAYRLDFMRTVSFGTIRNLGGKFGDEVERELGITSCGDALRYPLAELQAKFGDESGRWLYRIVRGLCDAAVVPRSKTKTMLASKMFRTPLRTFADIRTWLGVLSTELFVRLSHLWEQEQRWPRTLVFTSRNPTATADRSKSGPFPPRHALKSPDDVARAGWNLFLAINPATIMPAGRLALAAHGIQDDVASHHGSVAQFFATAPAPASVVKPPTAWAATKAPSSASASASAPVARASHAAATERFLAVPGDSAVAIRDTLSSPPAAPAVGPALPPPAWQCPRCAFCLRASPIDERDRMEHEDFHVAQDMQSDWRAESGTTHPAMPAFTAATTTTASSSKRARPGTSSQAPPGKKYAKTPITNYFFKSADP